MYCIKTFGDIYTDLHTQVKDPSVFSSKLLISFEKLSRSTFFGLIMTDMRLTLKAILTGNIYSTVASED
jgi:hypothetical protein